MTLHSLSPILYREQIVYPTLFVPYILGKRDTKSVKMYAPAITLVWKVQLQQVKHFYVACNELIHMALFNQKFFPP